MIFLKIAGAAVAAPKKDSATPGQQHLSVLAETLDRLAGVGVEGVKEPARAK